LNSFSATTPPERLARGEHRWPRLVAIVAALVAACAVAAVAVAPTARADGSGLLPRSPRRRLDAVDFDVGLAELKKYKAAHGDVMVPQSTVVQVNGADMPLGKWCVWGRGGDHGEPLQLAVDFRFSSQRLFWLVFSGSRVYPS
jgi:hypothetical protein